MRKTLEDYRVANAPVTAKPMPLDPPRAHFLGAQQDSALMWRVIGSLAVCAALLIGSFVLIG